MKKKQYQIACFGEVLWDIYPDKRHLGGAPFNVAAHLTQLGTQGHIITKVGKDELGNEILKSIIEQGIDTKFTQVDFTFDTGKVNVILDAQGKPSYEIKQPVAWDYIHTNLENLGLVKDCDGLIFGSLACRTDRNIQTLKDLSGISPLNICDLNIRQHYYSTGLIEELLDLTNILKINDEEEQLLADCFGLQQDRFYQRLVEIFDLDLIITTRGAKGAEAFYKGSLFRQEAVPVSVVDTVGSGDAFLAAFIHNYLRSESINKCLAEGARLGGFVATRSGAIPRHNQRNIAM